MKMNIQEAREEIIRTVRAYTARDEDGCFRIPVLRQRPILLMGPPGIGKTAIVEQAAEQCKVGLVSYAMTHHTRQSAVGLPELVSRSYEGRQYTVTEYTMSEIVASLYDYMEETGVKEGILFLDEINCVSETLAPTMLQLLQAKMFGTHRIPEGWILVAAGNPPEYNRAVRELDMATLDRVRTLEVEADVEVWRSYAAARGVHPAILSYLELKPEQFYQVTDTRKKKEFVTARGWEDLSAVLKEYERQGLPVDAAFMQEFLQKPETAADFDLYYRLDRKFCGQYRIRELLNEELDSSEAEGLKERLRLGGTEIRCLCVYHLLTAVSEQMTAFGMRRRRWKRLQEVLGHQEQYEKEHPDEAEYAFFEKRKKELQIRKEHALLSEAEEKLEWWTDQKLLEWSGAQEKQKLLEEEKRQLEQEREQLLARMKRGTDLIAEMFGKGVELQDWLFGMSHHGDYRQTGFAYPQMEELMEETLLEQKLRRQVKEMEDLYETDHCI